MEFVPFADTHAIATELAIRVTQAAQAAPSLVFLSGGSNVPLLAEMTRHIAPETSVIYTLADERHGAPGHEHSNWQQLTAAGAVLAPDSYPVLHGRSMSEDAAAYNLWLDTVAQSRYKIGIFGMGLDGHIAGILPFSPALTSQALADSYQGPDFPRITITPKMIAKMDEAYVVIQGSEKLSLAQAIVSGKNPAPLLSVLAVPKVISYYVR